MPLSSATASQVADPVEVRCKALAKNAHARDLPLTKPADMLCSDAVFCRSSQCQKRRQAYVLVLRSSLLTKAVVVSQHGGPKPALLAKDYMYIYGEPVDGVCEKAGAGVFRRKYSKAGMVELNCHTFTAATLGDLNL